MQRDDIDITVENRTLTIRGEKKRSTEVKEEQFHRVERSYGMFTRTFALPPTVDTEQVAAEYKNGLLMNIHDFIEVGKDIMKTSGEGTELAYETSYSNGKPRTKFVTQCGEYTKVSKWFPNGKIFYSYDFLSGKKDGKYLQQSINGQILRVDRFGNLVSNLDRRMVEDFAQGHGIDVVVGARAVGSLVTTYSDVPLGSVCALFGSSEHLEVAVSGGSAAERLGLARGATVALSRV
jgi:hypothetical protein